MVRNLILILLLCFSLDVRAKAIKVRNNDAIEVGLSISDKNRIAFVNDHIKSVYFVQDMANVVVNEDLGQVHVTLQGGLNDSFILTLVTKTGATIDLKVKPQKTSGITVLLDLDKRSREELLFVRRKKDRQIKKLIKSAYRILEHEDTSVDKEHKNLIQRKEYIGTKYKLIVYEYRNLKAKPEVISEHLFRMSPDTIAVAIKNKNLKPKAKTQVVVVEDITQQIKQWER